MINWYGGLILFIVFLFEARLKDINDFYVMLRMIKFGGFGSI